MGALSANVPKRYDLTIEGATDGFAFMFAPEAFHQQETVFASTPTFVPRQNVQGDYGDAQQDFWLTASQKDWSLGEQQKFFRGSDDEKARKFWRGKAVEIRLPGEVSLRSSTTSLSPAAAFKTGGTVSSGLVYFATTTTLYSVDHAGTISSIGAHGLGAAPSRWGFAADPSNRYLTTTTAGTVGVRKETSGAFTTWSATAADSLAFLNNTLYGYAASDGTLKRYSTSGTATTVFTWQDATGGGAGVPSKLLAFGGKLLIYRYRTAGPKGAELWLYDGTAPAKLAEFEADFDPYDMEVIGSTVYLSGAKQKYQAGVLQHRPAILFYRDGQQGLLWQAEGYVGGTAPFGPALAPFEGGLVFTDVKGYTDYAGSQGRIAFYDIDTGAVSTVFERNTLGTSDFIAGAASFFVVLDGSSLTSGAVYPNKDDNASVAEVDSSLFDFDSSLPKIIRGVRADFEATGTGTVDLSYRLNDLTSSYTSLQTNITSGQEYKITAPAEGTTHRSVSVRATLNRGATTTSQVKLKRLYVRAMHVQPRYKLRRYCVQLSGRDGSGAVLDRSGAPLPKDGADLYDDLETLAGRTAPQTITDESGSFSGVVQEVEYHRLKSEVGFAMVTVREV